MSNFNPKMVPKTFQNASQNGTQTVSKMHTNLHCKTEGLAEPNFANMVPKWDALGHPKT